VTQGRFVNAAAVALFFAGIVISGYYRARADREGGRLPERPQGLPSIAARLAFGIAVWGFILVQHFAPKLVRWSFIELPYAVRWLGLGLLTLAVAGIWWTMRNIGTNVSPSTSTRADAVLVTDGPYRWVRHPIYTLGFLLFLSLALIVGSIPFFVLLGFLIIWIPRRASREEANLIASYGDAYRQYMTRTGRFLPRFAAGR